MMTEGRLASLWVAAAAVLLAAVLAFASVGGVRAQISEPDGVTDLAGTVHPTNHTTSIVLTWTAPGDGGSPLTGYTLQRKSGSLNYSNVSSTIAGSATSYTDTGLTPGTIYTYVIFARNSKGTGASSNDVNVQTGSAPPAKVTDLSAAADGATTINLTWTTPAPNGEPITAYTLNSKIGLGNYAEVTDSISASATSYSHTGLTHSTTYAYIIRAENSEGTAVWSNEVSATTASNQVPSAVTDLAGTADTANGASEIDLTWTAPSTNGSAITGYNLQRKSGSGSYADVSTSIAAGATSYSDTGLSASTSYTYRIRANSADGYGAWSNTPSASTTSRSLPDAPSSFSGTPHPTNGSTSINLTWTTPATGGAAITRYHLERQPSGGSWVRIASNIAATATSYTDTGLTAGTSYTYSLRALNAAGSGPWARATASTSGAVPSAVSDLTATKDATNGSSEIDLAWTAPASNGSAITGYTLQRKAGSGDYANVSTTIGASATTYSDTGLSPGTTYTYQIRATNSEGDASWSNQPSETTDAIPPAKITDLTATKDSTNSGTEIDLAWTAPATGGAAISSYTLQRKAGSGSYANVSTTIAAGATSYSDTGLTVGTTYTYQIRAVNSVGNAEWSDAASETTDNVPDAVSDLTATKDATNGKTEIDLAWTAPASDDAAITSYTLQRKAGSGDYANVSTSIGASDTSYSDTGLTPGTSYTYQIRAVNSVGNAAWSNTPSATTDNDVPAKITGLTATKDATNGKTEIDLAWTAPDAHGSAITSYTLQRKAGSGSYTNVSTTIGASDTSYSDTGLTPGTSYTYQIRAVNAIGNAPWSNEASATTDNVPDAVSDLTATKDATNGSSEIDLAWTAPASSGSAITGYTLQRKEGSGSYANVSTTIGASATSYSDTGLSPGTTYTYQIRAKNSEGNGAWSNEPSETTDAIAPAKITDLTATKGSANSETEIDLAWTAPATGGAAISGYTLQRKAGSGSYANVSTSIAAGATSYSDTGLTVGTTYTYQIRAVNSVGNAEWSNEASATTQAAQVPAAITDLSATSPSSTQVNLTWTAPAANGAAITSYTLQRKVGSGSYTEVSSTIAASETSYSDTGLTPEVTYTYQIRAVNSVGNAAWSTAASATTVRVERPSVPFDVRGEQLGGSATEGPTGTRLRWERSTGDDDFYQIFNASLCSRAPCPNSARIGTRNPPFSLDTYDLHRTNLNHGTTYRYGVRAFSWQTRDGPFGFADITVGAPAAGTLSAPTVSNASVVLRWTASTRVFGNPITGFRVERRIGHTGPWDLITTTDSTTLTYTDSTAAGNTTYRYRIRAVNSVGVGDATRQQSATLGAGRPGAPTGLSATASGWSAVDLTWSAPASNGGASITGYTLQRKSGSGSYADVSSGIGAGATSYSDTGLAANTAYTYRIRAMNSFGGGGWSNEESETTGNAVPSAVSDLTATKDATNGSSEIDLAWTAPASGGSAITGYTLQRKAGSGDYANVSTTIGASATTYSDTGLSPGTTYTYQIRATNSEGDASWSNEPSETTDAIAPAKITDLTATKDSTNSGTEIDLAWTAPSTGGAAISGYTLQRKAGSGSYANVSTSIAAGATSYSDTGLTGGTAYTYQIRAVNSVGNAVWSNEASATTDNVPDAVSDLTATKDATNGKTEIDLAWTAPAANGAAISSYTLQRKAGSGDWENVSTSIGASDTSYSDTGLTPGTLYTYQIRAVNNVGNAAWSNTPSATTDNDVPAKITGLTATKDATNGKTEIDLAWTAPAAHGSAITSYTLQRKAGSGSYTNVSTSIGASDTSYSDTGLTPGTMYTYQIRAVNAIGNAPWSNEPSATTDNDVPAKITGLTATKDATNGKTEIDLAWTAPAAHGSAITSYTLQRKAGSGDFANISTSIGASDTSYSDTGLTPGTLYTYQIRAVNGVGNAPWSNEPSATTDNDVPAAITGMTATKSGARQVNLAWTTPASHGAALSGYRLERKAGTGNYALVTSAIGVTDTTYSDTGLTPATKYTYRLRATNSVGDAGWSNEPFATTDKRRPAKITDLTATKDSTNSGTEIDLAWTAPANHGAAISSYTLQRKTGSGSYANVSTTIAAGATSYSDTGLTAGTTYTYQIRAVNSEGDAPWSNAASETTASPPKPCRTLSATKDATNGATEVDLAWTAPASGGSAITGYRLERKKGTGNFVLASSSIAAGSPPPTPTRASRRGRPTPTASGPATPPATRAGPTRPP